MLLSQKWSDTLTKKKKKKKKRELLCGQKIKLKEKMEVTYDFEIIKLQLNKSPALAYR